MLYEHRVQDCLQLAMLRLESRAGFALAVLRYVAG